MKHALWWTVLFVFVLGGSQVYRRHTRYLVKTRDANGNVSTSDIHALEKARLLDWQTKQEVRWVPEAPRTLLIFLSGAECGGCLDEIRVWQRLATEFPPQELSVVAILVRATRDDAATFVRYARPNFRVLLDLNNEAAFRVRVPQSTPFKVLVDSHGVPILAAAPSSLAASQEHFGNLVASNVRAYASNKTSIPGF